MVIAPLSNLLHIIEREEIVMPSLILEGGTFRPIFSCGVMDVLLEQGIMFPYCIGVSAGISNGISYISMQEGRNIEIAMKYRNDKRYIGVKNYRKCRSLFGLDFVFGEIPASLVPFDWKNFHSYQGRVLVGVTNAATGKAEYLDGMHMDEKFTMLRATCALPMFFPAIEINGQKYFDGGLSDPVPIKKAIADGNKRHLIVLTRPSGYEKKLGRANIFTAHYLEKKYPKLKEVLLNRHIGYNETINFCEKLEEEGRAIIIRPRQPLDSFEKDTNRLMEAYQEGRNAAMEKIEDIREYFLEKEKG